MQRPGRNALEPNVATKGLIMTIDIKWYPPSWVQIKARNKIIYIDPAYLKMYYKNYPKKVEFSSWPDPIDGLPEKDLELADIILVTHHHKDHCKNVTVKRLKKPHTAVIATKRCLRELKKDIIVIEANKEVEIDGVGIKAVEAYNREKADQTKVAHRKGIGVGYVITIDGKSIYHAGDTDLVPEIGQLGKVEVAFLPIGGKDFTMNLSEAVRAAMMIQSKIVVPMHWFEADPQKFKKEVEKKSRTEVKVLQIGEVFSL
jgi:L-ascorbate metabolism protein UlaG (beta-lactamase superfamily)